MHAAFITQVVQFSGNEEHRPEYEALLKAAEESGWNGLVRAIRQIVAGQREMSAIGGLDEEDQIIAEAIMRGLQDPATLPDPHIKPDATLAAPGLAGMIRAASVGNIEALTLISNMAEQMSKAGGPMAKLAAVIRPLINGERDANKLCRGMNAQTEQIVLDILDELGRSDLH
ncbi:MAG: hypothetical protein ABW168_16325 [Sedimenticola sp.]